MASAPVLGCGPVVFTLEERAAEPVVWFDTAWTDPMHTGIPTLLRHESEVCFALEPGDELLTLIAIGMDTGRTLPSAMFTGARRGIDLGGLGRTAEGFVFSGQGVGDQAAATHYLVDPLVGIHRGRSADPSHAVAADPSGRLYVAGGLDRIDVFDSFGSLGTSDTASVIHTDALYNSRLAVSPHLLVTAHTAAGFVEVGHVSQGTDMRQVYLEAFDSWVHGLSVFDNGTLRVLDDGPQGGAHATPRISTFDLETGQLLTEVWVDGRDELARGLWCEPVGSTP